MARRAKRTLGDLQLTRATRENLGALRIIISIDAGVAAFGTLVFANIACEARERHMQLNDGLVTGLRGL